MPAAKTLVIREGWIRRLGLGAALCALAVVVPAGAARADDTKAQAQSLFESGLALEKQGNWSDACTKLEESNKLDPQPGTLFFLADCQEHTNKLASAWANFISVADKAESLHKMAHAKEARTRADALKVRLTKLLLLVPDELKAVPGLKVRRGTVEIGPALFGVPLPVDAGKHVIEVSGTGWRTWTTTVEAAGEGSTLSVSIPPLKEEPQVGPVVAPSPPVVVSGVTPGTSWTPQRKAAVALGAAGVAGLVVGGVFGGLAMGKVDASNQECIPGAGGLPARCTEAGGALRQDAETFANVANVSLIGGGLLAAAGVVVWLSAPASAPGVNRGQVAAAVVAAGTQATVHIRGSW